LLHVFWHKAYGSCRITFIGIPITDISDQAEQITAAEFAVSILSEYIININGATALITAIDGNFADQKLRPVVNRWLGCLRQLKLWRLRVALIFIELTVDFVLLTLFVL